MKSHESEKKPDYNVMLAKMSDKGYKAVIDVITQIPEKYDLRFPEGNVEAQINAITGFVTKKFKNLTPNEISEAFEMNAAHQLTTHIEFYGKLNLHSVGSLLYNYRQHKILSSPNTNQEPMEDTNIEFELRSDLRNMLLSGDHWNMTRYIDEKWNWLCDNRENFDSSLDEKAISELEVEFEKKHRSNKVIPRKYLNAKISAVQEFKMRKIRAYLEKLLPQFKEES
jgi:hypothetical protein